MDKIRGGNIIPGGQLPVINTVAPRDGIERVTGVDYMVPALAEPNLIPALTGWSEFTAPPHQERHAKNNDTVVEASTH